jgi:hypothetical protein
MTDWGAPSSESSEPDHRAKQNQTPLTECNLHCRSFSASFTHLVLMWTRGFARAAWPALLPWPDRWRPCCLPGCCGRQWHSQYQQRVSGIQERLRQSSGGNRVMDCHHVTLQEGIGYVSTPGRRQALLAIVAHGGAVRSLPSGPLFVALAVVQQGRQANQGRTCRSSPLAA